jgi:hypothetical protein
MKYLSFFFIICFFCHSCKNQDPYISDCEQAVNKQMGSSAKMLSKKYHMRPCAVTVAMPGGNIKYLELKFDMLGPLPQDAIRKILLNSVHDFLNNINSDSELCSYLKNGNMNICEVGITLFFHDTKGYHIHEPEIGIASISKGEVEYIREDPNEISIKGMKTTEESYEEALQILNSQVESSAVHKRCTD